MDTLSREEQRAALAMTAENSALEIREKGKGKKKSSRNSSKKGDQYRQRMLSRVSEELEILEEGNQQDI